MDNNIGLKFDLQNFNSLLPTIDFSYFRCHNTYIWVGWGYTKTFMKILGAPGGL